MLSKKLAVQLLTMHRTNTFRPLLLSLKGQTFKEWKLYWWDNASSDEEYEILQSIIREVQPDFEIVHLRSAMNTGFDGGHESLYQMHDAEYVALINDDAILTPTFLETLVDVMDRDPRIGAVSGVILRWYFDDAGKIVYTNKVDSMGLKLWPWQMAVDRYAGGEFSMPKMPVEAWKAANGEVEKVFGVSGCLPVYRRSAIGEQLFDPEYFYYKEDVDVAYRLRGKGFVSAVAYGAKAYHQRLFKPSIKRAKVPYHRQFCSYRNHLWNLRKHLTYRDWLKYGVFIIPFELVKAGFLLIAHPSILWRVWTGKPSPSIER